MKKNFYDAFSLMEMMVVLLIVAIVAAATAPMVTKKMARNAGSGDSPWVFTGLGGNIAYNMGGNDNTTVLIGTTSVPNGWAERARLFVDSGNNAAHIAFGNGNQTPLLLTADPAGRVGLSNAQIPSNSVAFGTGQTIANTSTGTITIGQGASAQNADSVTIGRAASTSGANAIAIGQGTSAQNENVVAIGHSVTSSAARNVAIGNGVTTSGTAAVAIGPSAIAEGSSSISIGTNAGTPLLDGSKTKTDSISIGHIATASGQAGIAIGHQATASGKQSVAIGPYGENGRETRASHQYSVAIGSGARTSSTYQIVLGTDNDTVYIPGRLIVAGSVAMNLNSGTRSSLRFTNGSSHWYGELGCDNGSNAFKHTSNETSGAVSYSTAKNYVSDRRLKNVGEKYTTGLDELKKLEFFHYTFKKDENKTPMVGVMAQDLQKVFPDAVTKGEDGYLRIRLEDMFYAVINAVKELDSKVAQIVENISSISSKVEKLEKENAELQQENSELKAEIKNIEKRIEKLEK